VGSNGNPVTSYQWDFGDGSVNATVENATHQYRIAGNWTVTLTVVDANGDTDVYTRVHYVTAIGIYCPPAPPGTTTSLGVEIVLTWIACFFVAGLIVGLGFTAVKRKARRKKRAAPRATGTIEQRAVAPVTAAALAMERERDRRAARDRKARTLPAAARVVHGRAVSDELERQAQRARDARKRRGQK